MGKTDKVLEEYLKDNRRFADLFNGIFFMGRQIISANDLTEASEKYQEQTGTGQRPSRLRDIKKILNSGPGLRILAIENQLSSDYSMPWRCMNYDSLEYGGQVKSLVRRNRQQWKDKQNQKEKLPGTQQKVFRTDSEFLCGMKKDDRLVPVYTICLYHGSEEWDGPRSLKEMMEFGDGAHEWSEWFADYPLRLVCVNELEDCSMFRSSLKELFQIMQYRKDKKGLESLLKNHEEFKHLDEDTMEAVSIMMNYKILLKNKDKYKNGEDDYNMCQAIEELIEDGRMEGMEKGLEKGLEKGRKEEQSRYSRLILSLMKEGKMELLIKAASDSLILKDLYKEYHI